MKFKKKLSKIDWNYLFLSKYYNYKTVLDAFFKAKPCIKPNPYWGIFYVPTKLYDYLLYLDNFVEIWYTNPKQCPRRVWGTSPGCISPGCVSLKLDYCCGVLKFCCISPSCISPGCIPPVEKY